MVEQCPEGEGRGDEPCGVFPGSQGQTGHLGGDADAAFVEETDGVFVAVAFFAEELVFWNFDIVEVDDAGTAGFDSELLLLLGYREALGALFNYESRDALVALAGIEIGKDDEEVCFDGVGDPHLGAIDLVS